MTDILSKLRELLEGFDKEAHRKQLDSILNDMAAGGGCLITWDDEQDPFESAKEYVDLVLQEHKDNEGPDYDRIVKLVIALAIDAAEQRIVYMRKASPPEAEPTKGAITEDEALELFSSFPITEDGVVRMYAKKGLSTDSLQADLEAKGLKVVKLNADESARIIDEALAASVPN